MELKVWVEGIQRIVCGVTESTTCQDVVFALAHATGKIGRFTLIERWRNNERLLAPQEYPLKILMKWGEYSNDIQFILRRSDPIHSNGNSKTNTTASTGQKFSNGSVNSGHSSSTQTNLDGASSPSGSTATSTYHPSPTNNPVGVVKGVPQNKLVTIDPLNQKNVPPYREPPPPYRSPPPPSQGGGKPSTGTTGTRTPTQLGHPAKAELSPEAVAYNTQYRELVSLVNYQREKLSNQQADLIKFDAEIGYWETKGREQDRQVDGLAQQITSADSQLRMTTDQVQMLSYVEDESEVVKQNEKTLKSEQQMMRSKLADCEAELTQLRNKMHQLMDDIQQQRLSNSRSQENRQQLERSIMAEMEGLQNQIQQAKHATEINHLTAETLKREVGVLESAILEKKRQVEQLVQEMKEANLQSLAGSSDELLHVLEGTSKPGSARRIIGSPRQLENAVPTNKNPHGVWV